MKDQEDAYDPIVPVKVGNAGPRTLWRPRDPLEGRGEQTNESNGGNMTILRDRATMSTKYIRIAELAKENKGRKFSRSLTF